MESENLSSLVKCCDCGCACSLINQSLSNGTYLRSVKRKCDEPEDENGIIVPQNARVEIGNECVALREMVGNQQHTVQGLISELEEERNASSSAANEAMSMILRLQREKAEIQMEARQFKRYVEEKIAHDQQETLALEDLLYKREQAIQSLTCEVQAYKHRMMSFGLTEEEIEEEKSMSRNNSMNMNENFEGQYEFPPYEIYPPLRCNTRATEYLDCEDETPDFEKYAFGETPRERFKDLENRINILEKSPRTIQPVGELNSAKSVFEKVIVGQSPRRPRHLRKFSADSSSSFFAAHPDYSADSPNYGASFKKTEFSILEENSNLGKMDNASEIEDDMSDRVYTIDSVHQGASFNVAKAPVGIGYDDYMSTPRDSVKDLEVQKLYARLHALEADRESMRQAIISIGTDKAQMVLLKEIAQNLCKEMSPPRRTPVKKQSAAGSFSVKSIFKWMVSFVFWRRKAHRCKYMFGLSENNVGLLMLLDRGHRIGHWKSISRAQM